MLFKLYDEIMQKELMIYSVYKVHKIQENIHYIKIRADRINIYKMEVADIYVSKINWHKGLCVLMIQQTQGVNSLI